MNLYIHIPFCKQRCIYCDFYTSINSSKAFMDSLLESLLIEIRSRAKGYQLNNIYLGGGTPSLLSVDVICKIFDSISDVAIIKDNAEITMEANPDDLNESYIENLRARTPINRISMGVQSFRDEDLIFLNRRHNSNDVYNVIKLLSKYDYHNISLDLIYGLPNQSKDKWQYNLDKIIEISPKHISAYHLIYEENTRLMYLLRSNKIKEVSEEDSLIFFEMLINRLEEAGYKQYEISNFAKPDFHARLNSDYWTSKAYIGIGPSAHSYDGDKIRRYNLSSIKKYTDSIKNNQVYFEEEFLSEKDIINEYIMTRLRTSKGFSLDEFANRFESHTLELIKLKIEKFISDGLIKSDDNRQISLSRKGIFLSDSIISDLFID